VDGVDAALAAKVAQGVEKGEAKAKADAAKVDVARAAAEVHWALYETVDFTFEKLPKSVLTKDAIVPVLRHKLGITEKLPVLKPALLEVRRRERGRPAVLAAFRAGLTARGPAT